MASDDRDRQFEKALARHLRTGELQSGVTGPPASGDAAARPSACPDAEALAAYHERLLPADQMIWFKQHLAGCANCQHILATLEATDHLLLASDSQLAENVVVMPAAASESAPPAIPSRAARLRHSPWRQKVFHGANWRWLAPAGALAAGLLLWISFHESGVTRMEIAKNAPQSAPPPFSPAASQPGTPQQKDELAGSHAKQVTRSSAVRGAPADSGALGKEEAAKNEHGRLREKKSYDAPGEKTAPAPENTLSALSKTPGNRAADPSMATDQIAVEGRAVAQQARRSPPAPSAPTLVPAPLQDQKSEPSSTERNALTPLSAPASKNKAIASGRQAPQEQDKPIAGDVAQSQTEALVRTVRERSASIVSTPDAAVLWRVGAAGIISRSSDTGATWNVQTSHVIVDLLAGSAPSVNVCWVVGREATILRTTDGGAHWQKVSSPASEDLAAVFAVSAQQATVSTASTHKTYRTTDTGQTWTLVPNP